VKQSRRQYGTGTPEIDDIVDAALRIIDREGVPALTLRALADELDSFTANLYRRIKDRDHVLDLVLARVMSDAALDDIPEDAPWDERLIEYALHLYDTWLQHRQAVPLLKRVNPDLHLGLGLVERFAAEFARSPLKPEEQFVAIGAYISVVSHGLYGLEELPAEVLMDQAIVTSEDTAYPALRAIALAVGDLPEDADARFRETFRRRIALILRPS
jgi:AcrR family transcriptional regulator